MLICIPGRWRWAVVGEAFELSGLAAPNHGLGSILRKLRTYGRAGSSSENGRNVAPAIRSIALR